MRISDWSSDVCSSDLGATPVTWQGWMLSFGLMLLLIAAIRFILSDPARFTVAAALVLAFCVIAARKPDGGRRWRWGSRAWSEGPSQAGNDRLAGGRRGGGSEAGGGRKGEGRTGRRGGLWR